MKTNIYTLLGMIKDNKAPKKIYYLEEKFTYDEQSKDYYDSENYGLFDSYEIPPMLNDEVEILETTITYKQDKIEKLDDNFSYRLKMKDILWNDNEVIIVNKINEIIDKVNKDD